MPRRQMPLFLAVLAALIFAPMAARVALAQETTGTILGTVTDPTGALIPDAQVVVTNRQTNNTRTTTTTNAGLFNFASLPIGDYELKVSKTGFRQYVQSNIHLDVNDKLNFHVALTVGAVTQAVTVTGAAPILQTASGEVSNLVGSAQMAALPLNGRDFNQLIDLAPGVAPDNGRVSSGEGLFSNTAASVNGALSNSNTFLVNGMYNEDNGSNANLLVTPSVDSIDEFKILRNNYSAEFGTGTGAIVTIVTKSGTREFHGDLYEFLRNDALDASNFFTNATNGTKSKLRHNDFGGTIGGPFWIPGLYNKDRSKDFFFFSQEVRRETRGNVVTDNVPSLRQTQGLLDPTCSSTPGTCTPAAADPFEVPISGEANVDPGSIDPNSAAMLLRYPLPNANFDQNGFNFIASEPLVTTVDDENIKWDHYIGQKARVMANFMRMSQGLNGINNQLWGDDSFPSVSSDWKWVGRVATAHLLYTINPHIVNDFRLGYSHNHISFVTSSVSDPTLASRDGFTYTELWPATSGSFPSLNSVENFGGIAHTAPFFNKTDNFFFEDDVALTFGKHTLTTGVDIGLLRKQEPANGGDNENAGTLTFNSFNDLLLGNMQNYSEEETLNTVRDRFENYAAFVQDDYKIRKNLTLNLGVRWQYLSPLFAAHDNIANFYNSLYDPSQCSPAAFTPDGLIDPTLCNPLNGIVTPATAGVNRSLVERHFNDWEPRFGMAWVPGVLSNKLVVRGGFGIYHGRDAGSQTSALGRQPPFDHVASINNITFNQLRPFDPTLPQPPVELSALDAVYNNPASYQYSLGIQYALGSNTTLETDYVGSHQIHMGQNRDLNQPLPQFQLPIVNGLDANTVRPFLGFSVINMNERVGISRYNSLQVFLNHRVDRFGLQFQVAYTWSRNLSNTINMDTEAHSNPIQDAYNPQAEWAVANQNTPNSFSANYLWALPWFRDAKGFKGQVLGGWQLVGITTFRTGLPVNICEDTDYTGARGEACYRPDLVSNPNLSKGDRNLQRFFDPNAYVLQPLGTFGSAARNLVIGPGINDTDFSIFKNFNIPWFGGGGSNSLAGEAAKLEFRAEFFNVFNHTQFSGVNSTFVPQSDSGGNPLAGLPADPSSGLGVITDARDPREIQLGLKFIF
ncbi:MAG TPA: carboxypeptidase regulatory-like domain-containing protein [Terriglobia bacterium]|nr:carboxypeptidase regulatory-like domain-containing protein [Terriglobia bacterium]